MSKLWRWLRLGVAAPGAMLLWSCVAPILTVPPPGAISFVAEGDLNGTSLWTVQGGPLPQAAQAAYYAINQRLGEGVIATAAADGTFTAHHLEGASEDQIEIYYRTPGGDYSEPTCVLLEAGASPRPCSP